MEWATGMKAAMVSLALDLVEIGEAPRWGLCNPAKTMESVSKDENMNWRVELESGWTTAVEILESYRSAAQVHFAGRDAETDWALTEWKEANEDAAKDPRLLRNRCDWAAKLVMLEQFAEAEGKWEHTQMQSLDLEYHNIDPEASLFSVLEETGGVVRLVDNLRIADAVTMPPGDTRARQRGELVASAHERLLQIGWRRAVLEEGGGSKVIEFLVDS
jgi:proteasome accessory factor A